MNAASPTDDEKRMQFGMIHGARPILMMGIPAAAWEELKNGEGQSIDLAPIGIPISLVVFGAPDKAAAIKFIEQAAGAMGIKFENQPDEPAA